MCVWLYCLRVGSLYLLFCLPAPVTTLTANSMHTKRDTNQMTHYTWWRSQKSSRRGRENVQHFSRPKGMLASNVRASVVNAMLMIVHPTGNPCPSFPTHNQLLPQTVLLLYFYYQQHSPRRSFYPMLTGTVAFVGNVVRTVDVAVTLLLQRNTLPIITLPGVPRAGCDRDVTGRTP